MPNKEFWKERKVLVTGHTGFKGSWMSMFLNHLGADLSGLALNPNTNPSLFDVLKLSDTLNDIRGDIRDIKICNQVLSKTSPEILIHMAAQPLVRESYSNPVYTFETNVIGTLNVLEASRYCESLKVILVVTSDKCYENMETHYSYTEDDCLGGHDPYSSSKACAESVTSAYYRSFFMNKSIGVATARAGNVLGGGDWSSDRLIPDAMRSFSKGEVLIIRNPLATRPWQHVLECISGYLLLCERVWEDPHRFSEAWNFGPNFQNVKTVKEVINDTQSLWGQQSNWRTSQKAEPYEATLLTLNIDKAKDKMGWNPKWDYDYTLKKTIDWYKNYYGGKTDMMESTYKQITDYSNL